MGQPRRIARSISSRCTTVRTRRNATSTAFAAVASGFDASGGGAVLLKYVVGGQKKPVDISRNPEASKVSNRVPSAFTSLNQSFCWLRGQYTAPRAVIGHTASTRLPRTATYQS